MLERKCRNVYGAVISIHSGNQLLQKPSKTITFWLFRHVLVHAETGTFRYFEIPRIRS